MSSSKKIEDIDEDIVAYNADSDDDRVPENKKSNEPKPEDQLRRGPASDLGIADGYDSSQPQQGSILREDQIFLVRGDHAFRGKNMPMDMMFPKVSTDLEKLELLRELIPELRRETTWSITDGNFRSDLDFLASIRVAEFSKILDDDNLPITHGVEWGELGRDYRWKDLSIYDLLDHATDEDEIHHLTVREHSNIVRNMSMEETRRTNHELSELLVWTLYLKCALQHMYELGGELHDDQR